MSVDYCCEKCSQTLTVYVPIIEAVHASCPLRSPRAAAPRYLQKAS
jgi:hypothetical protein